MENVENGLTFKIGSQKVPIEKLRHANQIQVPDRFFFSGMVTQNQNELRRRMKLPKNFDIFKLLEFQICFE